MCRERTTPDNPYRGIIKQRHTVLKYRLLKAKRNRIPLKGHQGSPSLENLNICDENI